MGLRVSLDLVHALVAHFLQDIVDIGGIVLRGAHQVAQREAELALGLAQDAVLALLELCDLRALAEKILGGRLQLVLVSRV